MSFSTKFPPIWEENPTTVNQIKGSPRFALVHLAAILQKWSALLFTVLLLCQRCCSSSRAQVHTPSLQLGPELPGTVTGGTRTRLGTPGSKAPPPCLPSLAAAQPTACREEGKAKTALKHQNIPVKHPFQTYTHLRTQGIIWTTIMLNIRNKNWNLPPVFLNTSSSLLGHFARYNLSSTFKEQYSALLSHTQGLR